MRLGAWVVVLATLPVFLLGACAGKWPAASRTPVEHPVTIDGSAYVLSQITAGTWTVVPAAIAGSSQASTISAAHRASLVKAIEATSGCSVSSSNYSRQGAQLDAQVDCGTRWGY